MMRRYPSDEQQQADSAHHFSKPISSIAERRLWVFSLVRRIRHGRLVPVLLRIDQQLRSGNNLHIAAHADPAVFTHTYIQLAWTLQKPTLMKTERFTNLAPAMPDQVRRHRTGCTASGNIFNLTGRIPRTSLEAIYVKQKGEGCATAAQQ